MTENKIINITCCVYNIYSGCIDIFDKLSTDFFLMQSF